MPDSMPRGTFLWGAASAAFQVEGHPRAEGRGLSKWDLYTHRDRVTEAVVGTQYDADTAIDAYDRDRYLADIALMKKAGLDAYRFSLSWTRILPAGTGHVNQDGVDHYSRFVDDLLEAGIVPLVTLYHWDFPEVLQERGGWHAPDSVQWFADYASEVFRTLGDRVDAFITLNEPFIDLFLMDLVAENVRAGKVPPLAFTSAQFGRQAQAMHHLLTASARAVAAYRASGRTGRVGIALPLVPTIPFDDDDPADVAAATLADGVINRWPLDATFRGVYPEDAIAALRTHNPELDVAETDLALMRDNPVDFVGVNFYAPAYVKHDDGYPLGFRWHDTNPDEVKAFNGPVRPEYLHRLLLRIRDDYDNPPVIITENGTGFGDIDEIRDGDAVHDPLRTDYIRRHVEATLQARADGADVRGYMCWSLFDNFEWIQGYERRFGMVWVDFETQQRIPKDSFHAYKALIRAGKKSG